MISITEAAAADIVKILAASQHSKYSWQQVSAYIGMLQQEIAESQRLASEKAPADGSSPSKNSTPKKAKAGKKS